MNIINKIEDLIQEGLNVIHESKRDPGLTIKEMDNLKNKTFQHKLKNGSGDDFKTKSPEMGSGNPDEDGMTPSPTIEPDLLNENHIPINLLKTVNKK
jgi:hypothetical protein